MKPTVLLATTSPPRWFAPARLAVALANAGWTVDCISVPRHTLGKATAVRKTYNYDGLAPLISYADAIVAAMPDLIIPCDDIATLNLHNLYWKEQRRGSSGTRICALIERSLGSPEYFPVAFARTAFEELARKEGIRVPKTGVIANSDDLKLWASSVGFPSVLKADCTSGGEGVRIVQSLDEAEHALRALQAPPLLARAAKRAIFDQDTSLVWPSLLRTRSVVNAQEFIPGREATSLIACWQGTVLASLHFEVLNKRESAGPATVIRWIDDPDMKSAAEKMARRLNLSGLHGFDFMLEAETGKAHLIEINPRATQVGHLALGRGRDLPAAMYAAVTGEAVHESRKVTENNTIVLFPHEWIRNPKSPYLQSGYHDVPHEEPELLRACLRTREKQDAWSSEQKWNGELSADQVRRP
jgi:Carbamoyl-phosphate synthase L chain, ATP binding domain